MTKAICEICGGFLESKSRHDFVECPCRKSFLDGGNDYVRCTLETEIIDTDRIPTGMSKKQFENWKKEWLLRIPKCKDFYCIHECDTCAIDFLCACGSIYSTYSSQKEPRECDNVGCEDCCKKYECENPQAKGLLTTTDIKGKLCYMI